MLPGFARIDQRRPDLLVDDPTRSARGTTTGRRPPTHGRSADEASAARADEPRQNLDDARETNAAGGLDRQNLPGPLVRDLRHVSVWPWAHQSSTRPVIHTWFGAGRCRPTRAVGGHAQSGHLQFRPLPRPIHPRQATRVTIATHQDRNWTIPVARLLRGELHHPLEHRESSWP
jgi:hypothetical protein